MRIGYRAVRRMLAMGAVLTSTTLVSSSADTVPEALSNRLIAGRRVDAPALYTTSVKDPIGLTSAPVSGPTEAAPAGGQTVGFKELLGSAASASSSDISRFGSGGAYGSGILDDLKLLDAAQNGPAVNLAFLSASSSDPFTSISALSGLFSSITATAGSVFAHGVNALTAPVMISMALLVVGSVGAAVGRTKWLTAH